jgi:hypothetical protein
LPVPTEVDLNGNNLPTVCGENTACTLNLGIAGQGGACSTLFPFVDNPPPVADLAAGQVLLLPQTFANPSCADPPTNVGELQTRYCSGASFNGTPVDCTFGTGKSQQHATIVGTSDNALPFDVNFLPPDGPNTHNVTCNPQSNDIWDFTIFGNAQLNVTLIAQLQIEGVATSTLLPQPSGPITCDPAVNNNLKCHVKACPDIGNALDAARNPDATVDITVTGELVSGTLIIGEQHIAISGN